MSTDSVDDLHYAEDLIGQLRHALAQVNQFAAARPWCGLGDAYNYEGFEKLLGNIRLALSRAEDYCRPTCGSEDHDTDECGCLCGHKEQG